MVLSACPGAISVSKQAFFGNLNLNSEKNPSNFLSSSTALELKKYWSIGLLDVFVNVFARINKTSAKHTYISLCTHTFFHKRTGFYFFTLTANVLYLHVMLLPVGACFISHNFVTPTPLQIESDDANIHTQKSISQPLTVQSCLIHSISDSRNYCQGQSCPYLTHWNKDIPLGINPEREPLIGSVCRGPLGTVGEVHPKTNECMTIKDQKANTVCAAMQLQRQSVFLLQVESIQVVLCVVQIHRNSKTKLFCIFRMDQAIYRWSSYWPALRVIVHSVCLW